MNKFLRLVEENRPGSDKYTVELKDFNGEVVDTFDMYGTESPFDAFGDFQKFIHDQFSKFKEEWGAPVSVEDQEEELSDEDHKTISNVNTAAERGHKEAQAAVRQAELNTKRKFDKELQKHRELTS